MVENHMIKAIRQDPWKDRHDARISKQYMSDGSVEMLVAMPMKGMLMDKIAGNSEDL
jgi:hypothetical protein